MEEKIYAGHYPVAEYDERDSDNDSFMVFLRFLRRFMILLIISTVIGLGIGLGMGFTKDKTVYKQTKSVLFLAGIDGTVMTTNLALTKKYIPTVKGEITTSIFIEKANEIYRAEGGTGWISGGNIGISSGDGLILNISYSDYDPDAAELKLNAFIKAAGEVIKDEELITADNVSFQSIDKVPKLSTSNGFARYVVLGTAGGLAIGLLLAFLIYLLDNTVSSKTELERLTGATVVAYIDDVAK